MDVVGAAMLPLRYLIGADNVKAIPGYIVETPYGEKPPPGGIHYLNLYDQTDSYDPKTNTGDYGPYLEPTDTAKEYGEGVVDPNGAGWLKLINDQLAQMAAGDVVEWDNIDGYPASAVKSAYDRTFARNISIAVKNPHDAWLIAHPAAALIIVENGDETAASVNALRHQAGKPNLPIRAVAFDDGDRGEAWARNFMLDALRLGLVDVGVTFDRAENEYGGEVEDLLLPKGVDMAEDWRPAKSLLTLLGQVNVAYPGRDKSSDGTKASPDHTAQNPNSDHEPNSADVVTALDITHDPAHGLNARALAEQLVASRDARIKYIISNAQIISSKVSPWVWRPYSGANAHRQHMHLSVMGEAALYDDPKPWVLGINVPKPGERRELKEGDSGADVAALQKVLGIPADGDFGSVTKTQVEAFQVACAIKVDGVVGSETWEQVDALAARMLSGDTGISDALAAEIVKTASASALAKYSWRDRGTAPAGYIPGMALAFAVAVREHQSLNAAMIVAAQEQDGADKDALAWYAEQFAAQGMTNTVAGLDTLRHLFVLMIGLGMREASGRYCEGRDVSASNVTADTTEAGVFQTSWNIRSASKEIAALLPVYWENPQGFLETFNDGVEPSSNNLAVFGIGDGARYQFLAKYCPLFAAMVTAVGLRTLRAHWGPITRREAEIRPEADVLLLAVQHLALAVLPPPPPPDGAAEVTITIHSKGKVKVTIVETTDVVVPPIVITKNGDNTGETPMEPIPNNEQIKSIIRWAIAMFGGAIAGWFASKGYSAEQITSLLNSEVVIGLVASGIALIWGMFVHSKVGILTAASKVPEVKKIELVPVAQTAAATMETARLVKQTPSVVVGPRP